MANIKDRLKQLRLESGLSQRELATLMGFTQHSNITKWENGYHVPRTQELKKLSYLFRASPGYILGMTDVREINHTVAKADTHTHSNINTKKGVKTMSKTIKSITLAFENVEGVDIHRSVINHFSAQYSGQFMTYDKDYSVNVRRQYDADDVVLKLSKEALTYSSNFDLSKMHTRDDEPTVNALMEAVIAHFKSHRDIVDITIHFNDGSEELLAIPWADGDWQTNDFQTFAENDAELIISIASSK